MANRYVDEFVKGLELRFTEDSEGMSVSQWITANTRLKKRPFSFEGHEFQVKIADDMHTDLSVIKCSQVGLTEIQIRKTLAFLKRNTGVSAIFTMPNDKMRDKLTQTRLLPLVNTEQAFNSLMSEKPVRSKTIVQVDQSFGYFTGSTEGDATSISADMLVHDEVDLTDQQMLGLFQSRLQHSTHKIRHRFSTPTYTGYGIDASYEISDKHEFMCKCPHCNYWQVPRFEPRFLCLPGLPTEIDTTEDLALMPDDTIINLDFQNSYIACTQCRRPLDLLDPKYREWVAEFPSRMARGYRVRPHAVGHISISYIMAQLMEYRRLDNIKGWWNTVLGEAYNDSNVRMSEADIRACMTGPAEPTPDKSEGMFIGIDVGQTCHITVGNPRKIVRWIQVPSSELKERVLALCSEFNIVGGGMDRDPYEPLATEIHAATNYLVVPMMYAKTGNAPAMVEHRDEFDQVTHFTTNRTMAIDAVSKAVRNHSWGLMGYGAHETLVVNHFRDMIRIEKPDMPATWQKLKGQDHFLHSAALILLAARLKMGLEFNADEDRRSGLIVLPTQIQGMGNGFIRVGRTRRGVRV